MSSQGSSSSRGSGHHADARPPRQVPGPKLQVQRSVSRDTITIHFSALGKEEDEDEEELCWGAGATQASETDEQSLVSKEELLFESAAARSISSPALDATEPLSHTASQAMTIAPSAHSHLASDPPASSSWPSDRPSAISSSHSKSSVVAAAPSPKPFFSLVRSLSNDVESRESASAPAAPTHARHRHLMKSFVKSLSTDTSKSDHQDLHQHPQQSTTQQQQVSPSQRPPPRNMQLFKQFSQPRLPSCSVAATGTAAAGGGDSKTAPSSPIMSPDGRSFFKVQEVEARIEDTKRRLSEVMSDPLQLFSKIMGDESTGAGGLGGMAPSGAHRARLLSSSASELSAVAAVNGHVTEGNSNYSIKEEEVAEGEEDEKTPPGRAHDSVFFSFPSLTPAPAIAQPTFPKSPSLTLGRCSMSALVARQEDEDFCELYSEDFELCTDTETPDGDRSGSRQPHTGSTGLCSELDTEEEEKTEEEESEALPVTTLILLAQLVYWYLVFPVPPYVCSVVHGVVVGFALALLVLWFSSPGHSSSRKGRKNPEPWNLSQLDIKEPGIFKVGEPFPTVCCLIMVLLPKPCWSASLPFALPFELKEMV